MGTACSKGTKPRSQGPQDLEWLQRAEEYLKAQRQEISILQSHSLAWSSLQNNTIRIADLEKKTPYTGFEGAQIRKESLMLHSTHVKAIPNTSLLVSLNCNWLHFEAQMNIFDISKKGSAKQISAENFRGNTGPGDVIYNSRRNILGVISLMKDAEYHLWDISPNASSASDVKLNRKVVWNQQHSTSVTNNHVNGFDINLTGESIATIDEEGKCLIFDASTDNCKFSLSIGDPARLDSASRCRFSSNADEPLLFVKSERNKLNILDLEKQSVILANPVQLERGITYRYGFMDDATAWIDVCPNNGNLLATAGVDSSIKLFDKRESKIVKIFDQIHSLSINCVRWSPSGDMLASASMDKTVKLLDFKTGKVIENGSFKNKHPISSVCFI